MSITFKSKLVDISIPSGISVYQNKSAVGKSYLPNLLKNYSDAPAIRIYSSQADYLLLEREGITTMDIPVIYFLDRADLFITDGVLSLLKEIGNVSIILDLKNPARLSASAIRYRVLRIGRMENGGVMVRDDVYD